jgi:hypothetical protein
MSMLSDLLAKAQQLEVEVKKEGTVLVGDAESLVKELVQNLEHEVSKEVGGTPASTATGEPAANADGVQKSSDLAG